ncbi:MAG TPA: non-homologous end-joining DNA ligase [Pseudomonadales bacterium]
MKKARRRSHVIRLPQAGDVTLRVPGADGRACEVRLTNLDKPFWPELGLTKRDLLQYYADVADALLPHVRGRAMVMKRYPDGWRGEHFFMKRTPPNAPDWLVTCAIEHGSGSVIDFPVVDGLAALLWVVNLGCIDLNPWYARCDDVDRPDFLHFDLDPPKDEPVDFGRVREAALLVRDALAELGIDCFAKTTGSRGIHVYVPIERGPTQKQVWTFAKLFALALAQRQPERLTAEYRIAKRPAGRVVVDYNQNAWGRTLASIYSVRPRAEASVSTPVAWREIEDGVHTDDFHIGNVPERIARLGDLWQPVVDGSAAIRLEPLLRAIEART